MELNFLIGAIVILLCVFASRVSGKLGVPVLLVFILLGMLFGSDGIFKIPFDNFKLAETLCTVALIFIMFYGGFGTKWSEAKPVAVKSVLLASLGVISTALITGLLCYFVLGINMLESLLIGSVLSSTDAASVFSILRSKKLNLKYRTASVLELESGSNDPFAYMMTIIILSVMGADSRFSSIPYIVFAQPFFGVLFGVLVSFTAYWILKNIRFTPGFDNAFVLAIAVLAYSLPALLGGNGFLSVYIVGLFLGNRSIENKVPLVNFFDGLTSLMQMIIFFLLGLLAFPSKLPEVFGISLAITFFLTFIARPLSVFGILSFGKSEPPQKMLVSLSGLRGAASIVFSVLVVVSGVSVENDIFHIVFCVVLLSMGIQGSLLPFISKKLDMIDDSENVLRTFNDYIDEDEIMFISVEVNEKHEWAGKSLKEISLPPDTIVATVLRGDEVIIPKGDTVLEVGDNVVLTARGFRCASGVELKEIHASDRGSWPGKSLSEIKFFDDTIVVLIKRGDTVVIPDGNTMVDKDDILVVTYKI